jgi:hypothetical protein
MLQGRGPRACRGEGQRSRQPSATLTAQRAAAGGANVKINDYLSFPLCLDLAPYTRPAADQGADGAPPGGSPDGSKGGVRDLVQGEEEKPEPLLYNLRGVIVHKGEASHGHYYCFMHKPDMGWFRVDDETVTPFDLEKGIVDKPTHQFVGPAPAPGSAGPSSGGGGAKSGGLEGLSALAEECFGGVDAKSKRGGKKTRNNNAFVLFYERAPDRHLRASNPLLDDALSSSSSDAPRSPLDGTPADPAVKELQTALQSLPDYRDYGTHPELEEVRVLAVGRRSEELATVDVDRGGRGRERWGGEGRARDC